MLLLFNFAQEVIVTAIRNIGRKNIKVGWKQLKLCLFTDSTFLHIANPEEYITIKLLKQIKDFSNDARYKIKM